MLGKLKRSTKDVALITTWAALYAAMVYVFAPISFEALQFRLADILPPSIAKKWKLAFGYAIGCVVANIISPFVGLWELIFMPAMSFVAGILGYLAAKLSNKYDYYICGIVHAVVISLSVAFMLYQLFELPMLVTLPALFVSELILGLAGATLFKAIERRWVWWR
jgi:uncharacterized membrane protein